MLLYQTLVGRPPFETTSGGDAKFPRLYTAASRGFTMRHIRDIGQLSEGAIRVQCSLLLKYSVVNSKLHNSCKYVNRFGLDVLVVLWLSCFACIECQEVLRQMLEPRPPHRITVIELENSAWVSGGGRLPHIAFTHGEHLHAFCQRSSTTRQAQKEAERTRTAPMQQLINGGGVPDSPPAAPPLSLPLSPTAVSPSPPSLPGTTSPGTRSLHGYPVQFHAPNMEAIQETGLEGVGSSGSSSPGLLSNSEASPPSTVVNSPAIESLSRGANAASEPGAQSIGVEASASLLEGPAETIGRRVPETASSPQAGASESSPQASAAEAAADYRPKSESPSDQQGTSSCNDLARSTPTTSSASNSSTDYTLRNTDYVNES